MKNSSNTIFNYLRIISKALCLQMLVLLASCSDIRTTNAQKVFSDEPFVGGTMLTHQRITYKIDAHFRPASYVPERYDIKNEEESGEGIQYIWYDDDKRKVNVYFCGFSADTYKYYLLNKYSGQLKDEEVDFYGLVDAVSKKEILPCIYNRIDVITTNMLEVKKNGKQAIFNLNRRSLSEFKYREIAYNFMGEMILLKTENEFGIMDTNGTFRIPLQPHPLYLDDYGLLLFKDSQYYFIDTLYRQYPLGKVNEPKRFMKGIGIEKSRESYDQYRFINLKGEALTPYCDDIFPFYENIGMLRNEQRLWALINREGKIITPFKYESVLLSHGSQGYRDVHTGYVFSNPSLETGKPVLVRSGENMDVLDTHGRQINPESYSRIKWCDSFIIAARKNEKGELRYGILNQKFQVLVPYEYEEIRFFDLSDKYGFEMKDLKHQYHFLSPQEVGKRVPR